MVAVHPVECQVLLQTGQAISTHPVIPSHMFENVPLQLITQDMAAAGGTSWDHISGNRKADFVAKDEALKNTVVHPADQAWLCETILKTQTRMAKIGQQLGQEATEWKQASSQKEQREVEKIDDSAAYFQKCYPNWLWGVNPNHCQQMQCEIAENCPQRWPLDPWEWSQIVSFLQDCRWFFSPRKSIAFVEMTYIFLVRKFQLVECDGQTTSFRQVYERLRKAFSFIHRKNMGLTPGTRNKSDNKNEGKALPAGKLDGVMPYMSNDELRGFAKLLQMGAGKALKTWSFAAGEVQEI